MPHTHRAARWSALWRQASRRRGVPATLLLPVAWLYGWLAQRRRATYLSNAERVAQLPVPVIVVGNVIAGGAGKTPVAIAVIRHLQAQGLRPGLVSRGYGRRNQGVLLLPDEPDPTLHGDEPTLIRQATGVPVCVGADRAAAARYLLSRHPDTEVLVCDDGLQHYGLGRDVAIAVFDDRGVGNGWLLPAGPLREPWPPRTIDRFSPHLLLCQAQDQAPAQPWPTPPGIPIFQIRRRLGDTLRWADGRCGTLAALRTEAPTLIAGIARPEVFFGMVRSQGLTPSRQIALSDHAGAHRFNDALSGVTGTVLCTDKDAVKLFPWWHAQPHREQLRIGAVTLITDIDDDFFVALDKRLQIGGPRTRAGALSSRHGHQTA